MSRKYKTSYKSSRGVKRFQVSFNASAIVTQIQEHCTICGGKIEESPMMRGVCYTCYQGLVSSPETFAALKEKVNEQAAYNQMDSILGSEPITQREMESMVELFDGTEQSPYIHGGEIYYPNVITSACDEDSIPF